MTPTALTRMTALTTILAATSGATAQSTVNDAQYPNTALAQATPGQAPVVQPAQPRVIPVQPDVTPVQPGMMGQGTMQPAERTIMGPGMMGRIPMMNLGGMGPRAHLMKVMFAMADANSDGGLSFEEVMAVHKRIFDRVDANKDGKVTPEEMQTFMRE